ncbi:MAG: winged helix-turn-helix domain-containing tetratricopeptide repeat protein [Hyphomicrobiaceae bacterium]
MTYRFGAISVDPQSMELRINDELVPVQPQVFALLVFLIENRDRVVTKDEIFDAVWKGRIVSDSALNARINALRRALGDSGEQQHIVRTIPRRGFRFMAPEVTPILAAKELAEAPTIAVLPFENMSGDAEQEYFSDGISEDIITDLSKVPGLVVIARNSSFAYKKKVSDPRLIGKDLGVGSVLEGSVRRAGQRVRITAQLINAATGEHLWAERYDRDVTDIFSVQDEVTLKIVEALKLKLTPGELASIAGAGTTDLEAHDCYLRARNLFTSPNQNAAVYKRAVAYAERAIERDPRYARAYAELTMIHVFDFLNRWSNDPEGALTKAAKLADRAVQLDPNDPVAHHAVSVVALWMKNRRLATSAIDRALALNPNYANGTFSRGIHAIFAGQFRDAIPFIERAMRLDPHFSQQHLHYLGLAHLLLREDNTAELMFRERLLLAPDTDIGRAMLAAALGHLGKLEEACLIWKELMQINPTFSLNRRLAQLPFDDPSSTDRILEGLRIANLID